MRFSATPLVLAILLTLPLRASDDNKNLPKVPKNVIYSHYRITIEISKEVFPGLPIMEKSFHGLGTAIGIGPRELILCNHEVAENPAGTYYIDLFDKDGRLFKRIPCRIKKRTVHPDICLVVVDEALPHFINPYDNKSTELEVGDWTYAVGAKYGYVPYNITWGELMTKAPEIFPGTWATTANVWFGNSGGGMYDGKENKFVGLVDAMVPPHSCTFFIPAKAVCEWLDNKENVLTPEDSIDISQEGLKHQMQEHFQNEMKKHMEEQMKKAETEEKEQCERGRKAFEELAQLRVDYNKLKDELKTMQAEFKKSTDDAKKELLDRRKAFDDAFARIAEKDKKEAEEKAKKLKDAELPKAEVVPLPPAPIPAPAPSAPKEKSPAMRVPNQPHIEGKVGRAESEQK